MTTRHVSDLMLSIDEYATISADCTVQEALQALSKAQLGLTYDRHHHRAVLVLSDAGLVVGKLSHWAVLRSLRPEGLNAGDVVTLSRAGVPADVIDGLARTLAAAPAALGRLCAAAAGLRVGDVMEPLGERIAPDAPLTEAIRAFVDSRAQSILVARDGRVIGILRLSDVFEEVAERIRAGAGEPLNRPR